MSSQAFLKQLDYLPDYLGNHLLLTLLALVIGIVVCLPLGCLVTRNKRLQWPVLTVAGVLQTIPGIALLALMVPLLGTIGFVPALIALILYSFLPILRNTVTGILEVDPALIEAARGIGMTDRQMLFKVELPLAMPVIIAGIRTATVWVVGTATLATPVGAVSLGNYIFAGLQTQNIASVLVGCGAAASLAIVLDQLIRLIEVAANRRSRSLGLSAGLAIILLLVAGLAPMIAGKWKGVPRSPVVIGSKTFTEQYILAELIADKVWEAGFEADLRPGMGSMVLLEALTNGSIDCYVDYSGTIWANAMQRDDFLPRDELLAQMSGWLKDNHGIEVLGSLGFENTYALAVRRKTAEEYGLVSIDDLRRIAPQLTLGSDYEFFSRPEWDKLKGTYRLEFNKLLTLDPSLMYSALVEGEADVITAFSTDGRIIAYDLVVLEDRRQAFPPYDAVLLLSAAAGQRDRLVNSLNRLVNSIDGRLMSQANKLVDLDGVSVDSAAAFLKGAVAGALGR